MFAAFTEHGAGEQLLPSFLALSSDDTDSVRIIAVQSCSRAAQSLSPGQVVDSICPLVQRWVEDKSWRIRKAVASILYPVSRQARDCVTVRVLLLRRETSEITGGVSGWAGRIDCALVLLKRFGGVF